MLEKVPDITKVVDSKLSVHHHVTKNCSAPSLKSNPRSLLKEKKKRRKKEKSCFDLLTMLDHEETLGTLGYPTTLKLDDLESLTLG